MDGSIDIARIVRMDWNAGVEIEARNSESQNDYSWQSGLNFLPDNPKSRCKTGQVDPPDEILSMGGGQDLYNLADFALWTTGCRNGEVLQNPCQEIELSHSSFADSCRF
jgi:hypothetical protein